MSWLSRLMTRWTVCRMHGHDIWPVAEGEGKREGELLGEPLCWRCGARGKKLRSGIVADPLEAKVRQAEKHAADVGMDGRGVL